MFKKMLNKNIFVLILEILVILIGIIGVTYAAVFATKLISVNITTAPIDITWTGDSVLIGSNILPINSSDISTKSISSTCTVKGVETNPNNVYYDIVLRNILISDNLKSADFKWQLYKGDTLYSSGSFSNIGDYNRIVLTPQILSLPTFTSEPDSYTIYIYIEETSLEQNSLLNGSFRAELGVDLYTSKGGATSRNTKTIEEMYSDTSLASNPVLSSGMIPITYNETSQKWIKADRTNYLASWYNYDNKKWANAIMVKSDKRDTYMNASLGTEITEEDILAYYVWVPRYKYKLFNSTFIASSPQEIDIVFETINDPISNGTQNDEYLSHPAFWWDNDSDGVREAGEELSGIWVGKFETSTDVACTATDNSGLNSGCNLSTINPRILPNVTSWRGAQVGTFFNVIKKIESTAYLTESGISQTDSHIIKNMEWGAVAYLSHSKYGKNTEVSFNSNTSYITGGGDYKTNVAQSTTGNITGIYDMAGGSVDYVMGVMEDSTNTDTPLTGYTTTSNNHSGFSGKLYSGETYTGFPFPDKKYYDLYEYGTTTTDQAAYNRSHLGDATGETRSWYGDYPDFIGSNLQWFLRGSSSGTVAGIFAFNYYHGQAGIRYGVRSSLINN